METVTHFRHFPITVYENKNYTIDLLSLVQSGNLFSKMFFKIHKQDQTIHKRWSKNLSKIFLYIIFVVRELLETMKATSKFAYRIDELSRFRIMTDRSRLHASDSHVRQYYFIELYVQRTCTWHQYVVCFVMIIVTAIEKNRVCNYTRYDCTSLVRF